jgi:hypothetical protein
MYYSVASYYTEDLTCYSNEVLKYCTTTYVAPAYTTQAPEYYTTQAPEYYTRQAPEYYTTQAPEYYTTQAPEYYTTTYAAQNNYIDDPKYYTTRASEHTLPLLTLSPPASPKLRKQYSASSYYTT